MTYRAAIVGCGRIGSAFDDEPRCRGVWTHAGAYAACPMTELTAVADVDPEALQRCRHRWNVPRAYREYVEMLTTERPDVVSVCTPSDTHAAVVRAALAAGAQAIWCEKPLTTSLAEADQLATEAAGCVVAVNHVRRWDGAWETARRWLQDQPGPVRGATAWYTGGVANIGSHLFDVARLLLGDPAWVEAFPAAEPLADPNLSGVLGLGGGALCQVHGVGTDDLLVFEVEILSADGRLRISQNGGRVDVWEAGPSARYWGYREFGAAKTLWEGEDERRMVTAVEDIVHAMEQAGSPRCRLDDGRRAVELVAAFLRSADLRRPVALPLTGPDRERRIPVR